MLNNEPPCTTITVYLCLQDTAHFVLVNDIFFLVSGMTCTALDRLELQN